MQVFRLEIEVSIGQRKELIGPWTAAVYDKSLEQVTWRYKDTVPTRPLEPHEDGIPNFYSNSDQICGWHNWEGAYVWCRWKDVTEALMKAGFQLNLYEVPEDKLMIGGTQCVWRRKDATLIRSVDWEEMIDICEDVSERAFKRKDRKLRKVS